MMHMRHKKGKYDRGGVSIFIVVFTALLVTIVTASFVQIVVRNQQSATYNDLSQSAYDAAMAGVEDAKRALVQLRNCQNNGDDADCDALRNKLEANDCEALGDAGVVEFKDGEVQVGDEKLNQAYTCVKLIIDRDFIDGSLSRSSDSSLAQTLPLRGRDAFNTIRVSWFSQEDIAPGLSPTLPLSTSLPKSTGWSATWPPIMRAQLIQFKKGDIKLSDFDEKGTKNARTVFLYPAAAGLPEYNLDTVDFRRDPNTSRNAPKLVECNVSNAQSGGYVCSVTLELPKPIGGDKNNREAYLQLQPMYNDSGSTHFKVELCTTSSCDNLVKFDGVRPVVDSTGRASDLFRRVKATIALTDGGPNLDMPDAALSVKGNICKDFFITNKTIDFGLGTCTP